MTDKEMLMLAYGALKANGYNSCKDVIQLIELHLFKPEIIEKIEPEKE